MKKIFLLTIIILISSWIYAQPGYVPRNTRDRVIATLADSGTHVPAFDRARYSPVIAARAGSLLVDSVGGGRGLYYSPGGNVLIRLRDTTEVGGNTSNGVRAVGDTIQLGGSIDKATHIQLSNQQTAGSLYTYLHLANRPSAEALIQEVSEYPTVSIYNPTTLAAEALYEESENDTAYLHYGGRFVSLVRNNFDSTSTRFAAANKYILLPSNGFEGVYQINPPRDTVNWRVGRDGQSANVMHSQWDLGQTWGYNINVVPESGIPDFPLTTNLSSIDLIRNIDNTRRKKMTGAGVSGYTSRYKSYQSSINTATDEVGNYWSKIVGFTGYGDVYPTISGATKAKTLAVATVDTAAAFWAMPQYRYTNTVKNGFGYVAMGDSDYNHYNGFVTIGGNLPTRQNSGQAFTRRLFVTGDIEATGYNYSFVSQAYGMTVSIPIAIGTEAGISFGQKDTAVAVGNVGTYLVPSDRAARGLYIRSEMFNGATMDNNSTGGFVQIETGVNHANVTRWHRNGNMAIGHSAATNVYRLYKKLTVNGSTALLDTLTIKNVVQQGADSVLYKPAVFDSDGNLYKGYWAYAGGGGGISQSVITDTLQNYHRLTGNTYVNGSQTGSFFGSVNSAPIRFRTNNTQRMYLDSARDQMVIGAPTINANDNMIIQGISGAGNYAGITIYPNNLSTKMTYGSAGIQRAGSIDINTSSGSLSLSPLAGVYIGTSFTAATAYLHIKAPTTSANTGQIKLNEGSRQTTPENGTINYVSDNIEFVETSTVYTLAKTLRATATLDFVSTISGNSSELTITVTGAADGDPVALAIPHSQAWSGSNFTAWVSGADTVTVRFNNYSGSTIDPTSASFTVAVIHY